MLFTHICCKPVIYKNILQTSQLFWNKGQISHQGLSIIASVIGKVITETGNKHIVILTAKCSLILHHPASLFLT